MLTPTMPQPLRPAPRPATPTTAPTALKPMAPQSPVTSPARPTTPLRATPAPAPGTPYAPGVNTYATNPQSDLRGQTIVPGQMADRRQIAQNYVDTWNQTTEPQYQADLRAATSQAAGAGQLGSGQLRTSLGNLAYNRDVQRQGQESNFLNNALSGSIEDAYRNVGIAQNQQAFQAALQNQTFNQGLQSLLAGQSGNPSDTQLALSGIYSNNAAQGGQSLSNLISGTVGKNATQDALQKLLEQYGIGSGGVPAPAAVPILNDTIPLAGGYG